MSSPEQDHYAQEVTEAVKTVGFGASSALFGLVALETLANGKIVGSAVFGALAIVGATGAKFHWRDLQEHREVLSPLRAQEAAKQHEEQVDAEIRASYNGL